MFLLTSSTVISAFALYSKNSTTENQAPSGPRTHHQRAWGSQQRAAGLGEQAGDPAQAPAIRAGHGSLPGLTSPAQAG